MLLRRVADRTEKWTRTQSTIAKLLIPRMFAGFRLHYVESEPRMIKSAQYAHHTDEVLVSHVFDWDVIYKTRDDRPWTRFLAEVDFLRSRGLGSISM